VPFLHPGRVTRIDSLHRPLLYTLQAGSTAIRYVTLCRTQARRRNRTSNGPAGEGAPGYTGLTMHVTAAGKPAEYLTLAGMTPADLSNGHLAVQFGTASTGVPYMEISRL
jgi:hypothetical protein